MLSHNGCFLLSIKVWFRIYLIIYIIVYKILVWKHSKELIKNSWLRITSFWEIERTRFYTGELWEMMVTWYAEPKPMKILCVYVIYI